MTALEVAAYDYIEFGEIVIELNAAIGGGCILGRVVVPLKLIPC